MPRIPYVSDDELPDQYDIIEKLGDRIPNGVDVAFWNQQPTVRTFSNNPSLGEAHVYMNTKLWTDTGLTEAECECVILTIARVMDFDYTWHDHVFAGLERAGLTEETILNISRSELTELAEPYQTLAQYATEYVESSGAISDETHERVAEQFDTDVIAGLAILSGYYVSLIHVQRALAISLEDEFVGWELESYSSDSDESAYSG